MTTGRLQHLMAAAGHSDPSSIVQLISALEAREPGTDSVLAEIHSEGGSSRISGATSAPGTGSTLGGRLVGELRA